MTSPPLRAQTPPPDSGERPQPGDRALLIIAPDTVRPEFAAAVEAVSPQVQLVRVPAAGPLPPEVAQAEVLFRSADFKPERVEEVLASARNLRWVHIPFAGVDGLLPPALVERQLLVSHAVGLYDRAVAEFALAFILAAAKRLPFFFRAQAEARWAGVQSWDFASGLAHVPHLLEGKTVAILGFGGIGGTLAGLLASLGVRVLGYRRSARPDPRAAAMYGPGGLLDLLVQADFAVLALPLTQETRGLIGARELGAMKPSAWLINVGRGAVVDEPALLAALEQGTIAGACLDVFPLEPLPPEHPFYRLPNVVLTPHVSGLFETRTAAEIQNFVDELRRYLAGQRLRGELDVARGY